MDPAVSVIIPCYNDGQYLSDAIASVEENADKGLYELIIVNDGSTENTTRRILDNLTASGYRVITQPNLGLPAARNTGIAAAIGKYIIPLDSDNKLHRNYLDKALDILQQNEAIDVIYGNPEDFGEQAGVGRTGEFDFVKMVNENYIDACAVYKKDIWKKVGGYDTSMLKGFEDWEFWINVYLSGGSFYYLDELCFYYRIRSGSMLRTITSHNFADIREYIYAKHYARIIPNLIGEVNSRNRQIHADRHLIGYINEHRFKAMAKLALGYKF